MASQHQQQESTLDRNTSLSTTSTRSVTEFDNHNKSSKQQQDNSDVEKQPRGQRFHHEKEKVSHFRLVLSQTLITDAVRNYPYKGSGTDEEPYVVEWIPNDPRNPMEWPDSKKWFITMTVAIATLAVAFVSSAYSGAVKEIIVEFGISQEVATLGISLFVLGFAVGPLLWAPLSELYGRQVLFAGTYMMLTAFNAGAAGANSAASLIVLRFLAGTFGSSPLTNAGGVIADMFPANQRGLAMSLFAAAPFLGPVLGPIAAGFLGESAGWRWVEGMMAIFSGVLWIFGTIFIPETYSPVILRRRALKLSKETGKSYISVLEKRQGKTTPKAAFQKSLARPWALLFLEPIVLLISIYMAILYGTLYMLFGAFPIVFQEYRGWSAGIGGLAFLGVMIGMFIGVTYSIIDNKRYARVEDEHDGEAPPEARLPPAMSGSIAIPIGMFWFAWTNSPSVHWAVSIAATIPFGFGIVLVFLACMNYLIDAYTIYAASVLAANSVLRSLFGAAFPLFTTYMYNSLGIHWASSIPAFLALVCAPFPFIFYKYGEPIRLKCKYAGQAHQIMEEMRKERNQLAEEEKEDDEAETTTTTTEDEKDRDNSEAPAQRTRTTESTASRPNAISRVSTRASRAEERGKREEFGRVYSHASHHHF